MRFRTMAVGAVILLGICGAARAETAEAEVRARIAAWADAFNANDPQAVCEIYAEDLVSVWRGSPDGTRAEACARIAEALADKTADITYAPEIEEVIVAETGDLAVARVVWTLGTERAGAVATSQERSIDVFRRDPDGAWRILRTFGFSTEPDE
jgi:steroid delta-isomerase